MLPTVAVISIGNELLSGVTVNSNLHFIGKELGKLGLSIHYAPATRDKKELLQDVLEHCLKKYDLVITTGGLGPTSDDITKQVVAECLQVPLTVDETTWQAIRDRFPNLKIPVINRKQAELPQGFSILSNSVGSAPGLYRLVQGSLLILLPGVPREMVHIFNEHVVPLLKRHFQLPSLAVKTIHTIDIPESSLAEMINDIAITDHVDLAYLPYPGRVDVRIVGSDHHYVEKLFKIITNKVDRHIWGIDDDTLPLKVHNLMINKQLSLAVAESCTGGMVQEKLTAIPNASVYFSGGAVLYSNEAKSTVLGVDNIVLEEYGAVSIRTAAEMARKVCKLFNSDVGISITGIAGPSGGTITKPVGTVCFGIAMEGNVSTCIKLFKGSRDIVREKAADYLLYLLAKALQG